jgi:hypothetical protein
MLFTDEAWFHLSGYVNSQNYHTWATENPHVYEESPLHPQKIGVWCTVSRHRIIGPLFFETTVTAEVYQELMQRFVALLQPDECDCWIQQDGASSYTACSTVDTLHKFFGERIISKGLWPPRSPDLSPPDFFLWSFLKNSVYRNKPHTMEDFKRSITACIQEIDGLMLQHVAGNMMKRVEMCNTINGQHFQHLM